MSAKHLSRNPKQARKIHGDSEAWWYEENGRICIVVENAGQFTIQASALREFLRRLDTPKGGARA